MLLETTILLIFSYLMGNFPSGFLYAKIFQKTDIRTIGSGSTGAMNVYRNTNKTGFFITFLSDVLKGSVVIFLVSKLLSSSEILTGFCGTFVILGHIYPILMKFKGGKGLGPFLGVMLISNWIISVLGLIIIPITSIIFRNSTLGVLFVVFLTPFGTFLYSKKLIDTLVVATNAILVIFAHRNNLKEILKFKNSEYNI